VDILLVVVAYVKRGEGGRCDDGDFFTDFVVFQSHGGVKRWAMMATCLPAYCLLFDSIDEEEKISKYVTFRFWVKTFDA